MNALVLALTLSGFAAGLLGGVWLGFTITTRDAGLIGVLDRRVSQCLDLSSAAKARADALEASWTEHLTELERKRAQARAERQRADAAAAKVEGQPPAVAAAPPVDPENPRERRRMLARGLRPAS